MNSQAASSVRLLLEVPDGREFTLFPDSQPIPPGALAENSTTYFHLKGEGFDPFQVSLEVDGVSLEPAPKSPNHVRWRWDIGFHAGRVELTLRGCPPRTIIQEVVTDPDRAKLTRDDFQQMVGDILQDTLALVTLTGHRLGIAKGKGVVEIARFEYLRRCFSRIEASIRQIDRAPWSRLQRFARETPLALSTGAMHRDINHAVARPGNVRRVDASQLSPAGKRLADACQGHLPIRVRHSQGRLDSRLREHADILAVLHLWRSFLGPVREALVKALNQAPENAGLTLMARQAGAMLRGLDRLTRLKLFEGISPSRGMIRPSHLYRRVPPYMKFYRAYRDFLSGLGGITGDFLNLPLRQTFDLYELWCFLRLARAAAPLKGPQAQWKEAFSEQALHGGLVLAIKGRPLKLGPLALVFQPNYTEVWRAAGPRVGSFSRPMQPDMAITGPGTGELPERPLVVLDAKYRIELELNDAITAIHTYRDSLVEFQERGDVPPVQRVVRAAFIISPYLPVSPTKAWKEEAAPVVFFRQAYRDAFRFGAVTMRPGITIGKTQELLAEMLRLVS